MKILIITQKYDLNDTNLGAFNIWWQKLAEKLDFVYILALEKQSEPPLKNMKVFSMGKERESSRVARFFNFYKNLFKILPKTDLIFIHMIPLYLILAWLPAKIMGNKLVMWYAGVTINNWVRMAVRLSDVSFTSYESGLRMVSKKRIVVGHGIDVDKFKAPNEKRKTNGEITILSIGRITPSKGHSLIIEAVADLIKRGYNLKLRIIGGVVQKRHEAYSRRLKKIAIESGISHRVEFIGAISYREMPNYFGNAEILINAVPPGGFDKVILEAMASSVIPLTSNKYVESVFPEELKSFLIFKEGDGIDLIQKLKIILDQKLWLNETITMELRNIVMEKYSLNGFIDKISDIFRGLVLKTDKNKS